MIASAAISPSNNLHVLLLMHEHHVDDFDEQTKSRNTFVPAQHIAYYFPASTLLFLRKPYRFLARDLRKSYQIPTPNLLDASQKQVLVSKAGQFLDKDRQILGQKQHLSVSFLKSFLLRSVLEIPQTEQIFAPKVQE